MTPVSPLRTPVALFIFNRPDCTARVLEAIAVAKPPALFVIADGPRPGHPEDERLISETRAVIDRVDWPCELHTNYSDVNLNCDPRIASGLDWVFAKVPEAILLEDDCVPDPTFFPYCEQLLERYRADERVHMISGSNVVGASGAYSYHFSRCYPVWGWASWARAWNHHDREMRAWPRLRETGWLENHLGDRRTAELVRPWFDDAHSGPSPQWDIQWMFSSWLNDALAVMPRVNLVSNIGFGNNATHKHDANHPFADVPAQPIEFPLLHPPRVGVLEDADRAAWDALVALSARAPRRRRGSYLADRARRLRGLIRARPVARRG
jgi:hypothetical protein